MAYLRIRDVPEDVRAALAERARESGQSLNKYLRDVVVREASFVGNRALIDEVVARRGRSSFTTDDVLAARDAGRVRSGSSSTHPLPLLTLVNTVWST